MRQWHKRTGRTIERFVLGQVSSRLRCLTRRNMSFNLGLFCWTRNCHGVVHVDSSIGHRSGLSAISSVRRSCNFPRLGLMANVTGGALGQSSSPEVGVRKTGGDPPVLAGGCAIDRDHTQRFLSCARVGRFPRSYDRSEGLAGLCDAPLDQIAENSASATPDCRRAPDPSGAGTLEQDAHDIPLVAEDRPPAARPRARPGAEVLPRQVSAAVPAVGV
jgi:hypothetical protein